MKELGKSYEVLCDMYPFRKGEIIWHFRDEFEYLNKNDEVTRINLKEDVRFREL